MNHQIAIVVVAYKRVDTLKRLLRSIGNGVYTDRNIPLIISIDFCETNGEVINCAEAFQWNYGQKIVKVHERNLGLKNHILECGDLALEYGAVIILEDDLLVGPCYYEYVKAAHQYYKDDDRIAGISLYSHEWNSYTQKKFSPIQKNGDVYFGQFSCTWGESWNDRQWKRFREWYDVCPDEFTDDGRMPSQIYGWNKSWGKYFIKYMVENGLYYVVPYRALSTTVGAIGVHTSRKLLDTQTGVNMGTEEYRFVPFEKGSHYNIFFENDDLPGFLKTYVGSEDICVDLYGIKKRVLTDNRYILTTRKMNYKIIKQYALDLRPHDMNVIQDIYGDDIFLYDRMYEEKNKVYKSRGRIMYDFAGVNPQKAVIYALKRYWEKYVGR